MIACTLEKLRPKLKGGRVHFSVRESTRVECEVLPVRGMPFTYWVPWSAAGKQQRRTTKVKEIQGGTGTPYAGPYRFTTKGRVWRITITDRIFAGT